MKANYLVNIQKCTTFLWIGGLMWFFNSFTYTSFVYLSLHGTYGFVWMIKEAAFPNKGISSTELDTMGIIVTSLLIFLPGYWTIALLAIRNTEEASAILIATAIISYIIGIVVMMVSDCQTYWILKYRPGMLITEGMNRYVRHPNYSGGILTYSSFCLLSRHWISWMIFFFVNIFIYYPAVLKKEKSLSRYPNWKEYKKMSGMYLPWIPSVINNVSIKSEKLN